MAIKPNAVGLEDYLPTRSTTARKIAYNNTLDRIRVELPPAGDAGASGCVDFATIENTWDALDAPGVTISFRSQTSSKHTFQYTVASIDTNVSVSASGSLDASGWFNLDANDELTTQTTDGTYGMTFDGMTKYVLFAFMAETGGTNVTITPRYLGGH